MGAILRGEDLEFEKNKYKVVEQYSYTKFEIGLSDGLVGASNGTLANEESSLTIKISLSDIYLIDTLDPQGVFEQLLAQNIDISSFSFSNGYICWEYSATSSVANLSDCASVSFNMDSEFLYINFDFVDVGTPITTTNTSLTSFTAVGIGGIFGFVKYGDKYVAIKLYADVKWGSAYSINSTGSYPGTGAALVPLKQTSDLTITDETLVTSQEAISQHYTGTDISLSYYILWNFAFANTASTSVWGCTDDDFLFQKIISKKDIEQ